MVFVPPLVDFVVVTLFYQTTIDHVYFYEINLRNLLYVILESEILFDPPPEQIYFGDNVAQLFLLLHFQVGKQEHGLFAKAIRNG